MTNKHKGSNFDDFLKEENIKAATFEVRVSSELVSEKGIARIRELLAIEIEDYRDNFNIFGVSFDSWILVAKPVSSINLCAPPKFSLMLNEKGFIDNRESEADIHLHFLCESAINGDNLKKAIKIAKTIIAILAGEYDDK
jgi:hypothetical protein